VVQRKEEHNSILWMRLYILPSKNSSSRSGPTGPISCRTALSPQSQCIRPSTYVLLEGLKDFARTKIRSSGNKRQRGKYLSNSLSKIAEFECCRHSHKMHLKCGCGASVMATFLRIKISEIDIISDSRAVIAESTDA
jgi:hypothetical protein